MPDLMVAYQWRERREASTTCSDCSGALLHVGTDQNTHNATFASGIYGWQTSTDILALMVPSKRGAISW